MEVCLHDMEGETGDTRGIASPCKINDKKLILKQTSRASVPVFPTKQLEIQSTTAGLHVNEFSTEVPGWKLN
ncbi:hypothetical protein K0M31_010859 [Melipona bicolor]|uniref:Uncharacterized protein n=1 Tax=Melipona bicolor TaxID=60889 RepID=A0AA40KI07_9HYME|nr:hypothetical protein K0M31_010859 [Melipona bicolor]